jgi:Glycosyl hydrolase family 47
LGLPVSWLRVHWLDVDKESSDNIGTNDVAGNYSLTLVDVLDTLAIMGDHKGFEQAVRNVIEWVQYNVDTRPQVFEVTIRALGGLLSGHIVGFYPKNPQSISYVFSSRQTRSSVINSVGMMANFLLWPRIWQNAFFQLLTLQLAFHTLG